jgi:hypothetical protein
MFVYDLNGTDIKLQPFSELPGGISRNYRGRLEEQIWEAFEWGIDDKAQLVGVIDKTPMSSLVKLFEAWQNWDGVDLGKSNGSATSSTESTETPSKQPSSTGDSV